MAREHGVLSLPALGPGGTATPKSICVEPLCGSGWPHKPRVESIKDIMVGMWGRERDPVVPTVAD